jgi:Short-chain dehydrogenases of various substrate specificities
LSCRAVITGATSGVGLAAAEALAEEGCDIIVSARGLDRLEALARDLSSMFGTRVTPVQLT